MRLPDPVHHNARGDGLTDNRFGQFQTAGTLAERLAVFRRENAQEVPRDVRANPAGRVAAEVEFDFRNCLGIFHAVDEGELRFQLLAQCVNTALNGLDAGLRFRSQAGLQRPAAEQQHAGRTLAHHAAAHHHGIRIVGFRQFALEDLRPEIVLFFRQALQPQPRARIEVLERSEVARLVGPLLRLGPVQILSRDHLVLRLQLVPFEHDGDDLFLELIGQFLGLGHRAHRLLQQRLQRLFVLVLLGGLGDVFDPPVRQFVVELARLHHGINLLLLRPADFPHSLNIVRRLKRERTRQVRGKALIGLLQNFLFPVERFFQLLVLGDDGLRRGRVLFVRRVVENPGKGVVIGLRNRVVLVIVAAGAANGQAHEPARNDVDAVVPFVGASDFKSAVVVVPRPKAEEAGGRQRLVPILGVHQIAGKLGLHELVVG